MGKNQMDVKEVIKRRIARLERIAVSQAPTDPSRMERHDERVEKSKDYLKELGEIDTWFVGYEGVKLMIVSEPTFNKQVEKADFATIEFDGEYCKAALVQNFPYDDMLLLYFLPIEKL